jgi:hypothetical protein
MKLELKLRENLPESERKVVFDAAREAGAKDVRALFPESPDATLASLHIVETANQAATVRVKRALEKHKPALVEYVDPETKRSLKSG